VDRRDKLKLILIMAIIGIAYVLTSYTVSSSLTQSNLYVLALCLFVFLVFYVPIVTICVFLLSPIMEVREENEKGSA